MTFMPRAVAGSAPIERNDSSANYIICIWRSNPDKSGLTSAWPDRYYTFLLHPWDIVEEHVGYYHIQYKSHPEGRWSTLMCHAIVARDLTYVQALAELDVLEAALAVHDA